MGQTLTRAAQWTRASDVGRGKLEFTPLNEAILSSIATFTEQFKDKHPHESAVVFKHPLRWNTSLKPSDVLATAGYVRKTDTHVVSFHSSDVDKRPFLEIKSQKAGDRGNAVRNVIEIMNFEELSNVLELVPQDKKLHEVRECLEANQDPIAKIFGEGFASIPGTPSDSQLLRYLDSVVTKELSDNPESPPLRLPETMNKTSLRLLLLLHQLDMYLMQQSVQKLSGEMRLTPQSVENEVQLLAPYTGNDNKSCLLRSINFTSEVVSQFGCRAPLWRQFHGDICYLEVKPFDGHTLYITCNTAGAYLNKGPSSDGGKETNYERVGNIYRDIRSLLKDHSNHFVNLISSEEFAAIVNKRILKESALKEKLPSAKIAADQASIDLGSIDDKAKPLPPRGRAKTKRLDLPFLDVGERIMVAPAKVAKKRKVKGTKALIQEAIGVHLKGKSYWDKLNNVLLECNVAPSRAVSKAVMGKSDDEAMAEESSEEEKSEEDEDEKELAHRMADVASTDLPPEYWQVQKLIKYVKAANPTGTVIALITLREYNLMSEYSQRAIREMGGIELFINLLETDNIRCKIASLKILRLISSNVSMCRTVLKLGGLQTMVALLHEDNRQVTALAAQNIAHMAKFRQVRRMVRQYNGVQQLVKLLKVDKKMLSNPKPPHGEDRLEEVRSAALALWGLSVSRNVRTSLRYADGIPRLATLLRNAKDTLLIPVVGILQECLIEESYQHAAIKEGMIPDLVKKLSSPNQELARLCAYAIFRCAEEPEIRDLVRKYGGLNPLVNLLTNDECVKNKRLLAAVTGALWKCAKSPQNAVLLQERNIVAIFIGMLNETAEDVLSNVVGALGECAQDSDNRVEIARNSGIPQLINLLTHTNIQLLINVCHAIKNCALDKKCLGEIEHNDGVRLMWSLLKHPSSKVQAAAANAICPCIELLEESGEMVRSFVGGLTLLVKLLNSESDDVLSSVCAAIAIICKDEENLAVLTDNGMVPLLARLTTTPNPQLQRYLAEAIARCSRWGNNRVVLGDEGAVAPLVEFLRGADPLLLRHTCCAVDNLSQDPANCIIMHKSNIVELLLRLMANSPDHILQEAAASCLANIRQVGLLSDQVTVTHRARR